jgi:diphthamide synthase subunit DPH2
MFQHARRLLSKHGKTCVQFLMAEIQPHKLALVKEIDVSFSYGREDMRRVNLKLVRDLCFDSLQAWVQIACPRLSMDWGSDLPKVRLIAPFATASLHYRLVVDSPC